MILKRLLGQILTDLGFVSPDQLIEAVEKQKSLFEGQTLPERLERDKLISEARMLSYADTIPLLGQILIDMQVITKGQLEEALKE